MVWQPTQMELQMLDYFYGLDTLLSFEAQTKFDLLIRLQLLRQELENEENQ
jgi:hypothetical protein